MIVDIAVHKRFYSILRVLKGIEVVFFCVFLLNLFLIFYSSYCIVDTCDISIFGLNTFYFYGIFIPLFAIFFIVRTAIAFSIFDIGRKIDLLFYISLFGLFLAYFLVGFYLQDILLNRSGINVDSVPFLLLISIFFVTALSFLVDKSTWHKTTNFVRLRIAFCLIHLTILIISPILSIIFAVLILPCVLFWKYD